MRTRVAAWLRIRLYIAVVWTREHRRAKPAWDGNPSAPSRKCPRCPSPEGRRLAHLVAGGLRASYCFGTYPGQCFFEAGKVVCDQSSTCSFERLDAAYSPTDTHERDATSS